MAAPARAFVIMPFADEFDAVYSQLIVPPLEEAGYEVRRADTEFNQRNILCDIVQGIAHADLIVAEITVQNPNVFYELGLAHGLRIPTVLVTQSMENVPFDLRSYRIIRYSTHFEDTETFFEDLRQVAEKHQAEEIVFGSPVTDFLPPSPAAAIPAPQAPLPREGEAKNLEDEMLVEKGYLDYLLEGEQASEEMIRILSQITAETNRIAEHFNTHTSRIRRLGSSGVPGTASQRHKIASHAARDLRAYSAMVEERLPDLEDSVDLFVESHSGFLGWLDPKTEDDRQALSRFRDSEVHLLQSAQKALANVEDFRDITRELQGTTRDLTKASQRATRTLQKIIFVFEKVEAFGTRIIATIDRKLDQQCGSTDTIDVS